MPLHNINQIEEKLLFEGFYGRIIHSKDMTVAYVRAVAGASLPTHDHPHEQIMNLIEGEFIFTVDGVEHHLKAGDIFAIPSNAPHSAKAVTDCRIIDVFNPPREDWKEA